MKQNVSEKEALSCQEHENSRLPHKIYKRQPFKEKRKLYFLYVAQNFVSIESIIISNRTSFIVSAYDLHYNKGTTEALHFTQLITLFLLFQISHSNSPVHKSKFTPVPVIHILSYVVVYTHYPVYLLLLFIALKPFIHILFFQYNSQVGLAVSRERKIKCVEG